MVFWLGTFGAGLLLCGLLSIGLNRYLNRCPVTSEQIAEAAKNKQAMESMLATDGWKLLEAAFRSQVENRKNQIIFKPTHEVPDFEYMKGEVQGMELVLKLPVKLIEESKSILEIAERFAEKDED